MDKMWAAAVITGICCMILLIVLLKSRAQVVLNFLVRGILGAICIIFLNDFFENQGISIVVGLNPISLLTVGTLGISGVVLLYSIVATKFL